MLEAAYVNGANSRIALRMKAFNDKVALAKSLTQRLDESKLSLKRKKDDLEKLMEIELELRDKANEATALKFNSRFDLYEELNKEVGKFGVKNEVPMYIVIGKDKNDKKGKKGKTSIVQEDYVDDDGTIRSNPSSDHLVYLGIVEEINCTTAEYLTDGKKMHMLTNATGTKLWIIPDNQMKVVYNRIPTDSKFAKMFSVFHRYSASNKDYEIELPDGDDKSSLGTAVSIRYKSDKIMQSGDAKGKLHGYIHDFDANKRPATLLEGEDGIWAIQIDELQINHRGILN